MPVKKIILTDSTIGSVVENDNEQKAQYLTAINSLINSQEFQLYTPSQKAAVIGEQINIYNVTNGERFTTYAIRAERNSGIISVNGAAAHKADPKDILIIATYAVYTEAELANYQPQLVYVNEQNRIQSQRNAIPAQAA